jgi:ring-1,2-phenylacetyl-CoA epoxidase subunit PaaD
MVTTISLEEVRRVVGSVVDPEIPTVTIEDLGILRGVTADPGGVRVTITPTYSGCPAMSQIAEDIRSAVESLEIGVVEIETVYSPAWTTDWMTDDARRRLEEGAISPPSTFAAAQCPRCRADGATLLSEFGSTACKALMVCSSCGDPFDLFKELR